MTDTSEELAARWNRLAVAPQNCSTDTGASNIRDGVQTVEEASSNEDNFEDSCRLSVLNLPDQSDLPVEQPRPIAMRTDEVRRRNRVPMQQDRRYSFQRSSLNAQYYPTVNNKAGLPYVRSTQPYSSEGAMASLDPPESAVRNSNPNTTHSTVITSSIYCSNNSTNQHPLTYANTPNRFNEPTRMIVTTETTMAGIYAANRDHHDSLFQNIYTHH
ncbi:hypothetical protein Aperf_G00000021817 [Anoplocephala perfoliata]